MMEKKSILYAAMLAVTTFFIGDCKNAMSQIPEKSSSVQALAQRIAPAFANQILFEELQEEKDVFELERLGDKIVIRGSSPIAMASGLNWFIKYYCHTSVSWFAADPIDLPKELPQIEAKIRRECAVDKRFFLNYCTFGYTMPWWQWKDWERFIDWMALNGITMPLAITGQEAIWQKVWMDFGLSDEEVRSYFTGPAHLPWHRMGNFDHWSGPLPQSYIDHQLKLQKQILERQRALGMTPILSGFTGHLPEAFAKRYPEANASYINVGSGAFSKEYITLFLDPEDPFFARIQEAFLKEQTKQYGTDHIYGVDPFNEMVPPSWEPEYLSRVSKKMYESLQTVDPEAVWLQMAWLFYHRRADWTNERIEALVTAVPPGKMILLDYYCDYKELWKLTESFFGQPYIWCYLGNFGGNTAFAGDLKTVDQRLSAVLSSPNAGNISGVGSTLEALDINPVMYEFVLEKVWWSEPVDLEKWIKAYARRRCGSANAAMEYAWSIMLNNIYCEQTACGRASLMRTRPALSSKGADFSRTKYAYDNNDLFAVWGNMLKVEQRDRDAYQFDLVNVASQALENALIPLHEKMMASWKANDLAAFNSSSAQFLNCIADIESLTATRSERLLGKWIKEARAFGTDRTEQDYYEKNARTLLTNWGYRGNVLNDYANRAWAGLAGDYYLQRWTSFVDALRKSIDENSNFNPKTFDEEIMDLEQSWINKQQSYPATPQGNSYEIASELYKKYSNN